MANPTPLASSQPRQGVARQQPASSKPKRQNKGAPDLYAHPLPLLVTRPTSKSPLSSFFAPIFTSSTFVNPRCKATWDPLTKSVWVTEQEGVEVLWRRGFWGKGSLSRSEPTWLQRARNRRALELDAEKRHLKLTAEEITAQRRIERRDAKILKAKEKLAAASSTSSTPVATPSPLPGTPLSSDAPTATIDSHAPPTPAKTREPPADLPPELAAELDSILDREHLQLMREDAFFLIWSLGCLELSLPPSLLPPSDSDPDSDIEGTPHLPLSISSSWNLFLDSAGSRTVTNPFLISYAAYHHFRSLGWVVRSGIKFCVDFVLYGSRGPVGGHAEFAVCVVPTFEDPEDAERAEGGDLSRERRSWKWFSTVNRVCAGVKKTLVFAYVVVPSSRRCGPKELASPTCIELFRIREVAIRRFIPARMRD